MTQTRRLLRQANIRARKGLGQHFLIDETVLQHIVAAAGLSANDIVIEIGPGLGVLTGKLVQRAGQVVAIELDNKLATMLKQNLTSAKNLTVVNEDVLKIEPQVLLRGLKTEFPDSSYKVVANIPYYITSPILRHFLEALVKPRMIVVMVQRQVAEEIVAKPGRMSVLSISVQLYGEPAIVDYVPAQCFYPPPEVDSAILRINLYSQPPIDVDDKESFFALVRAGFTASRKQIVNSLAQGLGLAKPEVLSLLERGKIAPQRRAETLTLEDWARLWRVFTETGEKRC